MHCACKSIPGLKNRTDSEMTIYPVLCAKRTKPADSRRRALLKDGQVVTVSTNRSGGGHKDSQRVSQTWAICHAGTVFWSVGDGYALFGRRSSPVESPPRIRWNESWKRRKSELHGLSLFHLRFNCGKISIITPSPRRNRSCTRISSCCYCSWSERRTLKIHRSLSKR